MLTLFSRLIQPSLTQLPIFVAFAAIPALGQHKLESSPGNTNISGSGWKEAELEIKTFAVPPGLKVDVWAAEPSLVNPVAFNFDEQGRAYVCETFRLHAGVGDIRGIMDWLDEELASRTVDERVAEMKRHLGSDFKTYTNNSERIVLLQDTTGNHRADKSTVFAKGFNTAVDGIAAGVLPRHGSVWYTDIPNLWLLRDTNADGVADARTSLHYGFAVRVGFLGHDLHGLTFGPDGKIYFSIGDRGSNVKVAEGRHVGEPDSGCVFRCYPDGSEFEVFAYGLRNPQDLVFDQYGNLFTGDNNSDSGDEARWVYVVEGGDSGWRVGFQFMENPYSRGPFNAEKLWYPQFEGQAANIVPPIANIASGPSGVAYYPGTGLNEQSRDHFFLVDFRGGPANSGIHTFTLTPKGASFELTDPHHFVWSVLATDVKFGVDGALYFSDWVEGWGMPGKGRIYRAYDPAHQQDPLVLETKRLIGEGMEHRSMKELVKLLAHPDMRVRQEAQFALADKGSDAVATLKDVANSNSSQLARIHAIWGLGQIGARLKSVPSSGQTPEARLLRNALDPLNALLRDSDAEVRAQAAKVLGDCHFAPAYEGLVHLLADGSPRVRFFSAISLGKLNRPGAVPALFTMLRENADRDPYLRHAGVSALARIGDVEALLRHANDDSRSVRMGVLLALRRLQRSEITRFLDDKDQGLVLEAARAINDEPINGGMKELAGLIDRPTHSEPLLRRVLNANFHYGTPETASALAAFAAKADGADNMRVEALEELGQWSHPSGKDRVVGLWRPVPATRFEKTAIEGLSPVLSTLLRSAPAPVRIAALQTAAGLSITNAGPEAFDLATTRTNSTRVRVAALKALPHLDQGRFEEAMKAVETDDNEDVRKAATRLQSLVRNSKPAARLASILEKGTLGEKQVALASLGALSDPAADDILARELDRLIAGQVAPAIQLDLIDAASKRSADSVKKKLEQYAAAKPQNDPLAPFEETLAGGDAAQGKKIFFERPDAQCVRCHKIEGQGGDVGPDLSHVAAQKDKRYLLESIVLPNKQIAPGFESVRVTTKEDQSYAGVLKSETPAEIVLNSPDTGLVTVKKSDIESRQKALSPMPEGIGQILTKEDIRNLVEYLGALK
jgi:quinoprotein glucose dehydrogenase